jgi:hypothetical protein
MLQFRKLSSLAEEASDPDIYVPVSVSFGSNTGGGIFYWFTNNYFEIALDHTSGEPFRMALIIYSRVYHVENKLDYPHAQQLSGLPSFKTRRWTLNKYRDPDSTRENEDRHLEVYLEEDALTIVFFPHPIKFMINNKRVSFGLDNNKALCLIRVAKYDEHEMSYIREAIMHDTFLLNITKETTTYLPLTLMPDYMVQLSDIALTSSKATLSINDTSLMSVLFDEIEDNCTEYVRWSIDNSITIVLNCTTNRMVRMDLLAHVTVFRINENHVDHSRLKKKGVPLFKTYPLKDRSPSDKGLKDPCRVYIQDDTVRISIAPHPIAMSIQNNNIIFGFNDNKSLCSLTIINLSEQEIACLEYAFSEQTTIIDATHDAIDYALITQGNANTMQLKETINPVKETTESEFYRPIKICFDIKKRSQQDYLYWRINGFFEMTLDRSSGVVVGLSLQRNSMLNTTSKQQLLSGYTKKKGLPVFKTKGWREDFYQTAMDYNQEVLHEVILKDKIITIRFLSDAIKRTVINQRVAFNFNAHDSLSSIVVHDLTDEEVALLNQPFDFENKREYKKAECGQCSS